MSRAAGWWLSWQFTFPRRMPGSSPAAASPLLWKEEGLFRGLVGVRACGVCSVACSLSGWSEEKPGLGIRSDPCPFPPICLTRQEWVFWATSWSAAEARASNRVR